jgi:hypothetical protein
VFVDCLTDYWDSVCGCVVRPSSVCDLVFVSAMCSVRVSTVPAVYISVGFWMILAMLAVWCSSGCRYKFLC